MSTFRRPIFETVEPVVGHAVMRTITDPQTRLPPQPHAAVTRTLAPRGVGSVDWSRRRLPQSAIENSLHKATQEWLAGLPEPLVPHEMARRFPRIANRLARLWDNEAACRSYFEDLRIDWRIGRQGFPDEVAKDIEALHGYFERRCEANAERAGQKRERDVWGHEPDRARGTTVIATTVLAPWHEANTRHGR